MISIDLINSLKPRRVKFLKYFFNIKQKSANINLNNFRIIFVLSRKLSTQRSYVKVQQYFQKLCKNNVMFERYA